jgi:response regulator RpfG family c-di-GMP phosphodiesterase
MLSRLLPNVLVVDDEPAVRMFLREAVKPLAAKVVEAGDAEGALGAVESGDFDIIVCDIWMQGATGLDLLEIAHRTRWDVGFILITGEIQAQTVISALRLQASDFLLKPLRVEDVTKSVNGAFERLMRLREARAYQGSLEASIQRRTHELEVTLSELQLNYQMTLEALVAALDAREHETFAHSLRVRSYTRYLACQAGYPPALMPALEQAALLHDIGKVAVADAILLKPAKLTPEEWKVQNSRAVPTQADIKLEALA